MRNTGIDETSKMFAFRNMLNTGLNNKLAQLIPQPNTLQGLVDKCHNFDANWQAYAKPNTTPRSGFHQGPRVQEVKEDENLTSETTVSAVRKFTSKKRGPLSQQEKDRCRANNLCMYCGGPGHMAKDCKAPPNKRPNPPN